MKSMLLKTWLLLAAAMTAAAMAERARAGTALASYRLETFQIWMPGNPALEHFDTKSLVGTIHSDVYTSKTDQGEKFIIAHVRVPPAALFFLSQRSLLNRSKRE